MLPERGQIRFATERTYGIVAARMALDHVILDGHHYLDNPAFRQALAPHWSASSGGERYTVIG